MSASDLLSLSIFGAFCTGLVERRPAACTGAELTQGLLLSCVSNRERFSRLPAAIGEWCRSSQKTDPRSLSFGNGSTRSGCAWETEAYPSRLTRPNAGVTTDVGCPHKERTIL
jgi:hypothetical protein